LRAKATPTVSTPLQWSEVASVAKRGGADRLVFESEAVLKRVKKHGDLFEPLLKLKQRLPSLRKLEAI
jgi:bifunctional non-homologous end joining protein LigD